MVFMDVKDLLRNKVFVPETAGRTPAPPEGNIVHKLQVSTNNNGNANIKERPPR